MSAIIHLMGRVTRDPVMQQGKNNGTEYISLDLATSQRSQNAQNNPENPYESVFYQCYLNKHLAERLSKAGVKKGTCLYIYGDLELHPFVYSQGQRAGQAGSGAKINVRDWQFCLSNKSEGDAGGNQAGAPSYNGGAATPGAGGYPNPGPQNGGYQNPAGTAQGGAYPANGNAAGNRNYPGGSNPSGGAAIPMAAMAMRMGTVIILMLVTAIQVPTTRITEMALQAIQMEAATWATARSLRTEEPRKAVLTRQTPLHRMVRLETRCTSSREGMPSTARHRRRADLPGTGLPISRKAWPHSFPSLHNFRITRLWSLPATAAPADHFTKGIACLRLNTAVPFLQIIFKRNLFI